MLMKVTLPNGAVIEAENGISMDELRDTITAIGKYNLNGAAAVETTDAEGRRAVQFVEPQGTRKGL